MYILTKIRLDRNQTPYWSARLMHEGKVVLEVQSKVFNPRNTKEFRELHENTQVRMMKSIQGNPDHDSIVRMLIQEDSDAATKHLNHAAGS